MENEIVIKRLSIIKLLYKIGVNQSYQNELTAFFSILSFHDSVEMFLKLAASMRDIQDQSRFMDYWDKMPELSLKESMRGLNNSRVNLKHKGLVPGKLEIEAARVHTKDFFEQHTELIFGVSFENISLFNLVTYEKPRVYLSAAQTSLDTGQTEVCIEEVTKAFYELLYCYNENKKDWSGKTPSEVVKIISPHDLFGDIFERKEFSALSNLVDRINDNHASLEAALEIISLGIDYRKYSKFKILTPVCHRFENGNFHMELLGNKNWSKEHCQFLIDFVLESAFRLQEVDYAFDNLDITTFELEIIENKNPTSNLK
jgi:hypothetical protein